MQSGSRRRRRPWRRQAAGGPGGGQRPAAGARWPAAGGAAADRAAARAVAERWQCGGDGGRVQSTQEDRDNAKLPPPPEQDSEISKLLRPGLLADVEIEVEKIPNALHVPKQAVFRKGGKPIVYVQRQTASSRRAR